MATKFHLPTALLALILVVTGTLIVSSSILSARAQTVSFRMEDFSREPLMTETHANSDLRIARRLQKRIEALTGLALSPEALIPSMRYQRDLLNHSVSVQFTSSDGKEIPLWTVRAENFPLWLRIDVTLEGVKTTLPVQNIVAELRMNPPPGIRYPVDALLIAVTEEKGVLRAQTDQVAKPGDDFDIPDAANTVHTALTTGIPSLEIPVRTVNGRIINTTWQDLGTLELITIGRSDFAGSGNGRKANVRKGLNRYLHNAMVPVEKPFSMNSVLKNVPISEWEMALGIFEGGALRPVAGGGLCQVATTLYRAILSAGFPITNRVSHSLFVTYYEKYGVGIDATIFPGKQDLTFMNNTGYPLLIQAYTEGDEAFVAIYGTPDGRTTALEGPFFSSNAPDTIQTNGRKLRSNEIAWQQHITFPDGRAEKHTFVSRYKSIPSSIVKKYLHAAAGEAVEEKDGI